MFRVALDLPQESLCRRGGGDEGYYLSAVRVAVVSVAE